MMRFPKFSKDRKKAVERLRVKKIGEVYSALATLLGLDLKKLNKVAILEAAVKFIKEHHDNLDIREPLIELQENDLMIHNVSDMQISEQSPSAVSRKVKVEKTSKGFPVHDLVPESPPLDASSPAASPLIETAEVSLPAASSCNKEDDSLLLCFEEPSYHDDDSGDDEMKGEPMAADFTQCCGYVPPTNSLIFSPNTPWLNTSSSPQIASVFATSFSPPMQPLQLQATPKLHHFSPPNTTAMYGPSFSNSPQAVMFNYVDEATGGGTEFYCVPPSEAAIQQ